MFTKGAPDILLQRCAFVEKNGATAPLTQSERQRILQRNDEMAQDAMRVLALCWRRVSGSGDTAEQNLVFCGLAGMIDPPRKEAYEAVAKCRRAGIRPVMITGDSKQTACAVAKELHILTPGGELLTGEVLTGEQLNRMDEEAFARVLPKVSVFARVTPAHKLRIVKALKAQGNIVAMTGDGVNDAPAVKEANIGVSMGQNGTDVTKEASDLILLDDNFATLVSAVKEGRVIYQNIRKFIRYLLSCNIGEVLTMFLGILMGLPVVLLPIHILLINLVTDGLPAIALGLEPAEKDVMKRPPRRASDGIFSGGLLTTILFRGALIGLTTLAVFLHFYQTGDAALARTGALLALVFAQLIHVFECKSEEKTIFGINPFRNVKLIFAVLLSASIALAAVFFPPAQIVFRTVPLTGAQLLTVAEYLAAAPILSAVLQKIFRKNRSSAMEQPAPRPEADSMPAE